jgi:hypothetical protein
MNLPFSLVMALQITPAADIPSASLWEIILTTWSDF